MCLSLIVASFLEEYPTAHASNIIRPLCYEQVSQIPLVRIRGATRCAQFCLLQWTEKLIFAFLTCKEITKILELILREQLIRLRYLGDR